MIKDYFVLSFGNLRHRGVRSWLTVIGIFIGIAAVVSLISMGQGLQTAVTAQFGTLSFDILTIQNKGSGFGPPGSTVIDKLNDHDVEIIENVRGVEKAIPRLVRVGSLEYNGIAGFGYGTDIPEDVEEREIVYENLNFEAEEGKVFDGGEKGKIVLGYLFFETEDFGKGFRVGKKVKINGKEFEILGFLKRSSSFQMNGMIFLMRDDFDELFEVGDEHDMILAKISEPREVENVAEEIKRKLRNDRNEKEGEESFNVETPLQAIGAVNNVLGIINLIIVGIAAISLLVGGIGIANTMYTSVLERTKEIGIMKAIGAKNKDILIIFLIESGLLGLVGGIVGALVGIGGALGIAALANQALGPGTFTINISYPLLIGAISFSFFVGIISGVLPSIQASKLNVVEALRS
jgi:putative ABC transport system permease protein